MTEWMQQYDVIEYVCEECGAAFLDHDGAITDAEAAENIQHAPYCQHGQPPDDDDEGG